MGTSATNGACAWQWVAARWHYRPTRCKDAVSLAPAKNGFKNPSVVKNSARQPSNASKEPSWNKVRKFRAGIQATKCVPPVVTSDSLVLGLVYNPNGVSHISPAVA